jgi:hypothetical protein
VEAVGEMPAQEQLQRVSLGDQVASVGLAAYSHPPWVEELVSMRRH